MGNSPGRRKARLVTRDAKIGVLPGSEEDADHLSTFGAIIKSGATSLRKRRHFALAILLNDLACNLDGTLFSGCLRGPARLGCHPLLREPGKASVQKGSNDGAHDRCRQVQPPIVENAGRHYRAKRPRRVEGCTREGSAHEDVEGHPARPATAMLSTNAAFSTRFAPMLIHSFSVRTSETTFERHSETTVDCQKK